MSAASHLVRGVTGRWSTRLLTILLLVAVCLLVLPVAARANVDKKHARQYKAMVTALNRAKNTDVESFNTLDEAMADTAQNIVEILASDPVEHDALLNEEANAAHLLDQVNGLIKEPENLQASCDMFWSTWKKWFRSRADRITLRQGLHNIDAACDHVITAYLELGSACEVLATDPPDVGKAREYNAKAAVAVGLANPQFTKAFKQLRSLQR